MLFSSVKGAEDWDFIKFSYFALTMKKIIETERLVLMPFEMNELELLHETFTHPFVRKFLWDDEVIPVDRTKEILMINEKHFERDGYGLWKVMLREDSTFTGFVGLWVFFEEAQPQLLYGLLPQYSGQGYATEASKAIIEYAFDELKFSYLDAACDAPHAESKNVCGRLNMKLLEEKEVNGKPTAFFRIENTN